MPINEKQYPIFAEFQHPQKKQILRYIELVYSKDSPLAKQEFDIKDLKRKAAIEAGLDPEKDMVQEIMALENEEVANLINFYLTQVQNNYEWTNLMTNLELFVEYTARVRKPVDATLEEDKQLTAFEKKDKLRNALDSLQKAIEKGFTNIFKNFDDEKNKGRKINVVTPETYTKTV